MRKSLVGTTHPVLHMKGIGYTQDLELVEPLLHEHQHDVWRLGYIGPNSNWLEQVVPNDHVVERVVLNDRDY